MILLSKKAQGLGRGRDFSHILFILRMREVARMPVLSPHLPIGSFRDIQLRNTALRILRTKQASEVMESNFDKLFFMGWDSALEDLFENFQLTDHLWVTRDTNPQEVIASLTFQDLRRLIVPVKRTYSTMSRRDLSSLEHQTVGCVGCLVENAVLWSVSPKQTVAEALKLMEDHNLSYLAVVEDSTFLGEVSVRRLAHEVNRIIASLEGNPAK
jgi:predicted transcriptional regulator